MFLCIYKSWPSWKIEKIACIYTLVMKKFEEVFDNIRWDVHQENPELEGEDRLPTLEGEFVFISSYQF